MSKGGSQVSTTKVDPEMKAAYLDNLEQAKNVAGGLGVQQFAGFNPMYQAGEEQLVNTAMGGPGIASTDYAAQMSALGGIYQPAQVQAAQANLGMSGPGSVGSYMNPYTSLVRQNALDDLESSRRAAIQQTGERATQARAFGGSRQGVAEGITNLGFAKQAGTLGTSLNESAFNNAMALQQADLARQQQAAGLNQTAGLQGAQQRLSAAGQLGNLGAQQQNLRLGGAQAVMGAGATRQALDQQMLDALRNIGVQKLGVVQSALGAQTSDLGNTVSTPTSRNALSGALGGAMAGSQFGPIGAIGGGILGLLG